MQPHEAAASSSRLPSLTGMRFIAAAMVFVFHGSLERLFRDFGVQEDYAFAVATAGSIGVSFFFVLSGFVLTWSARTSDTVPRFWRRRFFKIFPNHLVTFVVALVLMAWAGQRTGLTEGVANFFLLQSWVPEFQFFNSVNGVSWSLSVELLFYLSFPLLIKVVRAIPENRLWLAAAVVVAAVLLMPLVAQVFLPDQPSMMPWGPASLTQIWFVYIFPLVRALEFLLGMVLARIVLTGRWIGLGLLPATLLVVAGYVASLYVPFLYGFVAATVIPLALLIPAAATADVAGRKTWLSTRTMVWLGEISFAFYLVHRLVMTYGHLAFGRAPNGYGLAWSTPVGIAFLVAVFAVTLLLAWALYALVERPIMRRWASPRASGGAGGTRRAAPADTVRLS
ncbi:acyltransferase family protein [Streptomyces sp. NPDC047928]|uniref:acyltransferase family protein n=1 Tax=unclassified Streptomyces TaxID=2593676 RepID=UPI0037110575